MSAVIGADVVRVRLESLPARAQAALEPTMQEIASSLAIYIVRDKLSGQALNRVTGRLSGAINPKTVISTPTAVSAAVGSGEVPYAKVHEYGFSGTVNVPSYERLQTMAFGHPMSKLVTVRAHPMRVNLPERSFMRSSLQETAPANIEKIRATMRELSAS